MTGEIQKVPRRADAAVLSGWEDLLAQARSLASPEPPPDLWSQLRRKLEREGLIHDARPLPAGVLPFRRK